MSSPKRYKHEIILAVLEVLEKGPSKRGQVCFRAGLNWRDATNRLNSLVETGFVEKSEQGRVILYSLTEKGRRWLEMAKQVIPIL